MTEPVAPEPRSFWQRCPWMAGFYLLVLLSLCAVATWRPLTASDDFWAHVAVGRWICENGDVPRQTPFLWSASQPWVAHSWIFQLACYGLNEASPEAYLPFVVLIVTTILVAIPYVIVWWVWMRQSRFPGWALIPFALGIIANFHRYQMRPEIVSAGIFAGLLAFLVRWSGPFIPGQAPPEPKQVRRAAAFMFALFVAWANLHGAIPIGLLVLGVSVVCDLAQDRFSRRGRLLALPALLAPLAILVTPYGFSYFLAFRPVGSYRFTATSEWWPLWQLDPLPVEAIVVHGVLVLLAVAAWALNPQRRWSHLAWVLVLTALYVQAHRNIWFLTIGCLVVLGANSAAITPERLWKMLPRRRAATDTRPNRPPVVLGWVVSLAALSWVGMQIAIRIFALLEWDDAFGPVYMDEGVVQYMRDHRVPGRMFHDFENSRYLECQLPGEPELFISAHTASFPDQVMRDYLDLIQANERGRELLDEHRIGVVILTVDRYGPSPARLANFLDASKGWQRVYAARDGVIWVRRTPEYYYLWGDPELAVSKQAFRIYEIWFKRPVGCHTSFCPF